MSGTMKAIVYEGPKQMVIRDLEKPTAKANEVLIRVKYVSICGGDLHAYRSGYGQVPGRVMGHEYIGYAEEVGNEVDGIAVGDRVWGMNFTPCGTCWYCETGDYGNCAHMLEQVTGHGLLGGMAQYVLISPAVRGQTIHKIPDSISDEHAALIEPFGVGCDMVSAAKVGPDDNVVVIGCGMIGNAIIQFARIAGAATITAVDVSDIRLEVAKQCGATHTVNSAKEDVLEAVTRILGPNEWYYGPSGRADVVFETAGIGNTVNDAVNAVKADGRLVLVAPSEKDVNFNLAPVINKHPKFIIPVSGFHILETMTAMATGKLVIDPLITNIFPLAQAVDAFEAQMHPEQGMKSIIQMDA